MNKSDIERVQKFIDKWLGSNGNEKANKDPFCLDLCKALEIEAPPPLMKYIRRPLLP